MEVLYLGSNRLTRLALPEGLTNLKKLYLYENQLTRFTLPEGLTNLESLRLHGNQLRSLTLPEGLANLESLILGNNQLTSFTLPEGLMNLRWLSLFNNQLTNFTLPNGLTSLEGLYLFDNQLTSFTLPEGLTSLTSLGLGGNQLTSFTLPEGLTNLEYLDIFNNPLTSFTLPEGLTSLERLDLGANPWLTSLTLAEDTAKRFAGIDTDRGLAYNLKVPCSNVPLRKVVLPKRLDGKVFFRGMEDDVYNNLEFLFLDDLRSPRITRAEDALEISWTVGVLQTAASIEGPWKDVNASSPLRICEFFPDLRFPQSFSACVRSNCPLPLAVGEWGRAMERERGQCGWVGGANPLSFSDGTLKCLKCFVASSSPSIFECVPLLIEGERGFED